MSTEVVDAAPAPMVEDTAAPPALAEEGAGAPDEAALAAAPAPAVTGQKRKHADDAVPTAPIADELSLPLQAIMRIVKSRVPDGMMVGSETKKAFGKICSLFILYLSTM